jgi:hypothetical protein
VACRPFGPDSTSNLTVCPFLKCLGPEPVPVIAAESLGVNSKKLIHLRHDLDRGCFAATRFNDPQALKQHLSPASYGDLQELLERFSDSVIEFSTYPAKSVVLLGAKRSSGISETTRAALQTVRRPLWCKSRRRDALMEGFVILERNLFACIRLQVNERLGSVFREILQERSRR